MRIRNAWMTDGGFGPHSSHLAVSAVTPTVRSSVMFSGVFRSVPHEHEVQSNIIDEDGSKRPEAEPEPEPESVATDDTMQFEAFSQPAWAVTLGNFSFHLEQSTPERKKAFEACMIRCTIRCAGFPDSDKAAKATASSAPSGAASAHQEAMAWEAFSLMICPCPKRIAYPLCLPSDPWSRSWENLRHRSHASRWTTIHRLKIPPCRVASCPHFHFPRSRAEQPTLTLTLNPDSENCLRRLPSKVPTTASGKVLVDTILHATQTRHSRSSSLAAQCLADISAANTCSCARLTWRRRVAHRCIAMAGKFLSDATSLEWCLTMAGSWMLNIPKPSRTVSGISSVVVRGLYGDASAEKGDKACKDRSARRGFPIEAAWLLCVVLDASTTSYNLRCAERAIILFDQHVNIDGLRAASSRPTITPAYSRHRMLPTTPESPPACNTPDCRSNFGATIVMAKHHASISLSLRFLACPR
ncbi:uncharacterized protein MYCFIDRAFT_209422 [Pseudocercospora fijiensis CIRAD86]|uniref:Uncharacterized protein n=1 Tax=Pseudocercospora fijiensis (strain CIRAD86) TaxID=383855 RepID=M2ZXI8_PSEFD|nr:uncharacterized protein MYCFIDRAFT_209422 [Pseudocercospora fijiensis CIRAD86]EME76796.1 hypothetical protein MYCFIDRAFT_209422 [Pseudocercospora fijiensis CIRAD86]